LQVLDIIHPMRFWPLPGSSGLLEIVILPPIFADFYPETGIKSGHLLREDE
jgi:hypothetical protein